MDQTGRGFAVDERHVADGGIGGECGVELVRIDWMSVLNGERNNDAVGLGGQATESVGVLTGLGEQDLPAGGQEGSADGLHREVTAALEDQSGVLAGSSAGDVEDAFTDLRDEGAEFVVPWGIVACGGGPHRVMCRDWAGDEQQHEMA